MGATPANSHGRRAAIALALLVALSASSAFAQSAADPIGDLLAEPDRPPVAGAPPEKTTEPDPRTAPPPRKKGGPSNSAWSPTDDVTPPEPAREPAPAEREELPPIESAPQPDGAPAPPPETAAPVGPAASPPDATVTAPPPVAAPPAAAPSEPPARAAVAPSPSPPAGPSVGTSAWPPEGASPEQPSLAAPPPPGGMPVASLAPLRIEWRVENPFRLFVDPKDTEVHRATFESLSVGEREKTPVHAAEAALARRHNEGWAATMWRKTCWDVSKNRYVCPDTADYVNPKSHVVLARLEGIAEPQIECVWLTAPRSGAPRGVALRQPCGDPAEFDIPYPGGVEVAVEVGGREVARTEIRVRDIFVVGMGDSFASGEGNPDVPVRFSPERAVDYGKPGDDDDLTGYPARVGSWKTIGDKAFVAENARWLDQACHRSLYSYQLRTALQIAVEDPHRAVTYAGFSCSGAEVTFGLFLRYAGNEWVPRPPDLSQISAIADAQCGRREAPTIDMPEAFHIHGAIKELEGGLVMRKCPADIARKIDLALVAVGGNDIGFARLVANAVLTDQSLVKKLGGWFGQLYGNLEATALLDRVDERYKSLNRAMHGLLHVPWEESDRILLTAYPPLAVVDDDGTVCPDGKAGMEVLGDFNLTQKNALSSMWLADKLHDVMENGAKAHGWSFAENFRRRFIGRGLCAGYRQVIPSVADDLRIPRKHKGVWTPYNPSEFEAYAPRVRWFRTPNDAFMTGNFHVAGSVIEKVLKFDTFSWFQILLAATYSGAFHPTAEGHAAMADSSVEKARAVLRKYEDRDQRASATR